MSEREVRNKKEKQTTCVNAGILPQRGTRLLFPNFDHLQDLSLPKSMVARLAKGVLPANTQIQKDALLALHKSATVFINFIASNANENAQSSGKKTIMPPDVVAALKDAEFEDFLPRLEAELKKYNDTQCDKRNTYRRKVKEEKKAADPVTEEGTAEPKEGEATQATNGTNGHVETEMDDADRPAKKLKGDAGQAVAPDADGLQDDEVDEEPDADDHEDDEGDDDGADEDEIEESEGEEGQDQTMEDPADETEERGELRDEALDEPDSD
ncbi:hypothetical protein LTR85_003300 [Meristemomyces frigidus]|nr:hypothetical protein LTR85_003300 [Meristemomyces frigidus]